MVAAGAGTSDGGTSIRRASDPRTAALIGLLYAAGLLGKIFPAADQSRARELAMNIGLPARWRTSFA